MRTFDRLSATATFPWVRAQVDRLRRTVAGGRPAVRWGLILAAVLGLAGGGYWTAMALVPVGTRYLASGHSFAADDLIKVGRALEAKGIGYHVEDRKVVVAADQYDQAAATVTQLDVGPHPFDEIRKPDGPWSSVLDSPGDRRRKEQRAQERMLEGYIHELDGVISAVVSIHTPPAKAGRARAKPSVFVWVETEADHALPSRTVASIPAILMSNVPDLSPQAITVMDRNGHQYYDPRNPAVGDLSRNRAREEEIRQKILSMIAWIPRVQVWVDVIDQPGAEPAPAVRTERPRAEASSAPAIRVNQPAELDEPGPSSPAPTPPPAVPARDDRPERGRILVNVPRSFYFHSILPRVEHREPSLDERQAMAARTKEQVVKAVHLVVPDTWTVEVDTIPDEVTIDWPSVLPSVSDARRKVLDWGIVAVGVAAVALVTALASWFQMARRPARPPEPVLDRRRYRADPDPESNPSERVRELVRRDPEAAAGVLERWIAQGGAAS